MTDTDARLSLLLAADDAPARDFAFEQSVMVRVEQRRVLSSWLRMAGYIAISLAVVWAAWPTVSSLVGELASSLQEAGTVLLAVIVVSGALWTGWRSYEQMGEV